MSNTQNQNQNQLQDGIYRTWATKKDVIAALRQVRHLSESSKGGKFFPVVIYVLAHGECEAPDYVPCRYKDGWGIKEIPHFYPGTFHARASGRRVMQVHTVDSDMPPEIDIISEKAW